MINRAGFKAQAKLSMKSSRPSAYLVTFVYLVIGYVLSSLSVNIQFGGNAADYYMTLLEGGIPDITVSPIASLIVLAISLMSAVLAYGYRYYCMRISRGQSAGVGELFDGFGIFFKVIWLNILTGIFTFLWSLLFWVPGIVAAYRYSMSSFILLDDPDTPVMECIRRSKAMTKGYKGSLFVLDLSFIGWNLLRLIPFVSIFVEPYYQVTLANYYNALSAWRPEPEGAVYEHDYREPWEK